MKICKTLIRASYLLIATACSYVHADTAYIGCPTLSSIGVNQTTGYLIAQGPRGEWTSMGPQYDKPSADGFFVQVTGVVGDNFQKGTITMIACKYYGGSSIGGNFYMIPPNQNLTFQVIWTPKWQYNEIQGNYLCSSNNVSDCPFK